MASGGDGNQKRQPRNMEGLLKFCLELTQDEDKTAESTFDEMDNERKQWLQEALANMTVDVVKQMKELCKTLLKDDEFNVEDRQEALENLTDLCVDLDLAADFHKIGGFSLLPKLLSDPSPEIRWRTGDLMASLVQNNPYCQLAALDMDLLSTLLKMVDDDPTDIVKVKSMYATSCLCRNLPEAYKAFIDQDGFSYLMRAMQKNIEKLQTKAIFLLMDLCRSNAGLKDTVCNMGMVEQLINLLNTNHTGFHEHLLCTIVSLVTDNEKCAEECRRPELQLCSILERKIEELKSSDEYQEEFEYSKKLMDIVFTDRKAQNACR